VFVEGPKTWLFPVAAQTKSLPFSQGYVIMQCFFYWQNVLLNFDLKNTILTYTKDFSNYPNSPDFDNFFFFQVARFLS
jgi:hypothetical protein